MEASFFYHLDRTPRIEKRIVVVDGLIGAGKTTFCRNIAENFKSVGYKVRFVEEAVVTLKHPTLNEYYHNPKEHAYAFQMAVIHALGKQLLQVLGDDMDEHYDLIIFDRWLPSTVNFIEVHYIHGNLTIGQKRALLTLVDSYMRQAAVMPYLQVFFSPDLDVCDARIIQRAETDEERVGETEQLELVRRTNVYIREMGGHTAYTPFKADDESGVFFSMLNKMVRQLPIYDNSFDKSGNVIANGQLASELVRKFADFERPYLTEAELVKLIHWQ